MDCIVLCIGNTSRGDDGVAHEVARLLDDFADAEVITTTACDVTLAPRIAHADLLVVVDAARRTAPLVDTVTVDPAGLPTTHACTPAALLTVAKVLMGAYPRTVLVSVAAPDMEHAESLSATARAAAEAAAREVERIVAE